MPGSGNVSWFQILTNSIGLDAQHFFLTNCTYLLLKYKYTSEVNINGPKIQVSEYMHLKASLYYKFSSNSSSFVLIFYPSNKCTFREDKRVDTFSLVYWVLLLLVQFWIVLCFSQVYHLPKAIVYLLGEMHIILNPKFYMFTSYYWCLLWFFF